MNMKKTSGERTAATPLPTRAAQPAGPLAPTDMAALEQPYQAANADYRELRRRVETRGLLAPQPRYLAFKVISTLVLLGAGLVLLALVADPWLRLLATVFLAIVFTQIGLVGHDVGHRQTLRAGRLSDALGLIFGNLLLGISCHWWIDKHNRHHSHANEAGHDPDLDVPLVAFDQEEAVTKRGLARFIVRRQAYLLFPLMFLFQAVALRVASVDFLLAHRAKHHRTEVVLLVLHVLLYVGVIVALVGGWQALVVIALHQGLFGLYMGAIFAPNHKGMPLWEDNGASDFLRQQVLTARNVRGNPLIDWWYGGLNYQIEHHLFPTMPRNKLRAARVEVQAFCQARGIAYHETGCLRSYREILAHMHEVGAPLRASKR